jgi:prepilin-type N-terminal cleavage/methylation domain-containing protein
MTRALAFPSPSASLRRLLRGRRGAGPAVLDDSSGFTLLETIIAMAIMVLALSSILAVESGSINASIRTKQMNIVAMLAKGKMVATEHAFQGKTFEEFKKEETGTFEAPYQDFRWKTEVKEIEFPTLAGVGGKGEGEAGGAEIIEQITKLVTKFLSKAVREVNVSVIWKKGAHDQTFTLSTYWVDLNHEFELSQ